MTTGATSEDWSVSKYLNCGTAKVGVRSSRSWSGTDGRHRDNPYTMQKVIINDTEMEWYPNSSPSYWRKGTMQSCFGGFGESYATQALIDASITRALKGVLGKYRQHDFSGAVFLGEARESTKLITESIMPVLRAFNYVRKGKFSRALKVLRQANAKRDRTFKVVKHPSSAWLSLRYGWIPMISDAYAYADAMQVIASGKKSQTILRSSNKVPIPQTNATIGGVRDGQLRVQVILKTDLQMSVPSSLGFTNPALLAWELLPGSFILDWVVDVSSWLELYFDLPQGQATRYITTIKQTVGARGPFTRTSYTLRKTENSFLTVVKFERRVTVGVSVPTPRFKNPFNGSLTRILDMAALASSLKH